MTSSVFYFQAAGDEFIAEVKVRPVLAEAQVQVEDKVHRE